MWKLKEKIDTPLSCNINIYYQTQKNIWPPRKSKDWAEMWSAFWNLWKFSMHQRHYTAHTHLKVRSWVHVLTQKAHTQKKPKFYERWITSIKAGVMLKALMSQTSKPTLSMRCSAFHTIFTPCTTISLFLWPIMRPVFLFFGDIWKASGLNLLFFSTGPLWGFTCIQLQTLWPPLVPCTLHFNCILIYI